MYCTRSVVLAVTDQSSGFKNFGIIEFPLNVFTEFSESNDNIFVITVKRLKSATSCVRDRDVTTSPARHM